MYAIIEDGSHQFRVREGDRIRVDRRDGKPGDELVFTKVLLIASEKMAPRKSVCRRSTVPRLPAKSSTSSGRRRSLSRSSAGARMYVVRMVIASRSTTVQITSLVQPQ